MDTFYSVLLLFSSSSFSVQPEGGRSLLVQISITAVAGDAVAHMGPDELSLSAL